MTISIKLQYVPKPRQTATFEQDLEAILLNDSNQKVKRLL